jgi:penicillin-binding protein-related factor A (putative recombinase)
LTKKNLGKQFEEDIQKSCSNQGVFFHRIRDVYIPIELRSRIKTLPNKYDSMIFSDGLLLPIEMKSTAAKSFSLDESIIKQHQIDALLEATQYEFVYAGLLFNFRTADNATYFVPIQSFVEYQKVVAGEWQREYKSKVNKSSIQISICEEVGLKLKAEKKRVHWRYDVIDLIHQIKRNMEEQK